MVDEQNLDENKTWSLIGGGFMNKEIKVAIVGFGYMGRFHYIKTKSLPGVRTVGIFDFDDEVKKNALEDGLKVYSSFEELIMDEIDLVVVSTPNDSHFEYAKKALENGKNVLCEKPVVLEIKQLQELIDISEKNKLVFTVHQNRRWDKDFSVIKKVIDSKIIGDPVTIWSETFGQRGVCFGWRADPSKGGGMLYDWGIHLIDQALMLFKDKKVISIYGELRSVLTPVVDDYFEVELKFENDVTVHITMGTFALIDKPRWYMIADRGTLKIDDFSGKNGDIKKIKENVRAFARVKSNSNVGPSRTLAHLEMQNFEDTILPTPDDKPLEFWRNLIASVRGDETTYITHSEMMRDLVILNKVIESNRLQQRLEVEL